MEKIEVIGFDWDGTLVDSMPLKAEAFADSVHEFYPETEGNHDEIKNIYLRTRGNPRTYQLELVQEEYGLNPLSEEDLQGWSDEFTSNYIDEDVPLFSETNKVLDELNKAGYTLYLSSSVPQDDLDETMERYDVEKYFVEVLGTQEGGFRKGPAHIKHICDKYGVEPEQIAFVGDSPDDVEGANEAGSYSVGIADGRMPDKVHERMRDREAEKIVSGIEEVKEIFG